MKYSYPGLSENAVTESRQIYGANIITTQDSEGFFGQLSISRSKCLIARLGTGSKVTGTEGDRWQ